MDLSLDLRQLIADRLPGAAVEITDLTGGGDHFGVLVASEAFAGKHLLEQHRIVMEILGERLRGEVHAVKITTMTPDQYRRRNHEEDAQ